MKQTFGFCVALLLPFAGLAGTITGQVNIYPGWSGGTGPFSQTINSAGSLSGSATGGLSSSGSGFVYVDYGVIKSSGEALGALTTVVIGDFADTFVITAPGVASGTAGTLTYSVALAGSLDAESGFSAAIWNLQTIWNGASPDIDATGRFETSNASNPGYSGDPFGVYTATVSFVFGGTTSLEVSLNAQAQADYSLSDDPGSAQFDLSHSLYWAGFSGVTASGSPLGSYTVTSGSGANWAESFVPSLVTPEPGTAGLLALALGVWRLRRRQRSDFVGASPPPHQIYNTASQRRRSRRRGVAV